MPDRERKSSFDDPFNDPFDSLYMRHVNAMPKWEEVVSRPRGFWGRIWFRLMYRPKKADLPIEC